MPPAADPALLLPEALRRPALPVDAPTGWCRAGLAGRITELVGGPDSSALTQATSLVLDAQREGELVAWVTRTDSHFFPPDIAAWGVDLGALVVVRVASAHSVARAADRLARSGAFGLIAMDLGPSPAVPSPLLSRLLGLAIKHDIALLCLTEPGVRPPQLGSLVSLRVASERRRLGDDRFATTLRAVKDKRRAPGWTHTEICCGPPGLR
jgi:recombination protein RecA